MALSAYGLRRVAIDDELRAPVLNSGDRATLVDTVALLDPFALTDAGREALLASLRAGPARVAAAASDAGRAQRARGRGRTSTAGRQASSPGSRAAARGAAAVEAVFSLAELVWLGHPPPSLDLDRLGRLGGAR